MLQFVFGLLAILNVALASFFAYRSAVVGGVLVSLLILLDAIGLTGKFSFSLAGFTVLPVDAATFILLAAGITRVVTRPLPFKVGAPIVLFGILVCVSVVRGILAYGAKSAGLEARVPYINFIAAILYFVSHDYTYRVVNRIVKTVILTASGLVILATLRWVTYFSGVYLGAWSLGPGGGIRVLPAPTTMVLVEAWFLVLYRTTIEEGRSVVERALTFILPFFIVLLQHRTLWVVSMVGLALLFLKGRKKRGKFVLMLMSSLVVGLALSLTVFAAHIQTLLQSLQYFVLEALNPEKSSWIWRVEGWKSLLSKIYLSNPTDFIVGQPFGAGYERVVYGSIVDVSPHNYYVQTLVRTGFLGLASLAGIYVSAFRRVSDMNADTRLFRLLVVLQLIYYIPYSVGYEYGMFLGVAVALLCRNPTTRTDSPVSMPSSSALDVGQSPA